MKNAREVQTIDRMLEIFSSPNKWTKKARARNKHDNPTGYYSTQASCWCVDGALEKALRDQKLTKRKHNNSYWKIVGAICKVTGKRFDIGYQDEHIGFNDDPETTYEMLIDALKRSQEFLKKGSKKK